MVRKSNEQGYYTEVGFAINEFEQHTASKGLKYYPVIMYLKCHIGVLGTLNTCLREIIVGAGYNVNRNKEIKTQFLDIIQLCQERGRLQTNIADWSNISLNSRFEIFVPYDSDLFFQKTRYVVLNSHVFDTIVSGHDDISTGILIGVYLQITQHIGNDGKDPTFFSYRSLADKLDIDPTTVKKSVCKLNELGLLFYKHYERENLKGDVWNTVNLYTTNPDVDLGSPEYLDYLSKKAYRGAKVVYGKSKSESNTNTEIKTDVDSAGYWHQDPYIPDDYKPDDLIIYDDGDSVLEEVDHATTTQTQTAVVPDKPVRRDPEQPRDDRQHKPNKPLTIKETIDLIDDLVYTEWEALEFFKTLSDDELKKHYPQRTLRRPMATSEFLAQQEARRRGLPCYN